MIRPCTSAKKAAAASAKVRTAKESEKETMTRDLAERRAVRKYLLNGEQPQDGPVLTTRVYPQRTFVIAKDSAGRVLWAFWTAANRLYRIDGAYLIAVENEEMKAANKL